MTYQFKERDWKIGDGAMPDEAEAMLDRLEAASQRVDEYYRDLERIWAENDARRKAEQNRQERRGLRIQGVQKTPSVRDQVAAGRMDPELSRRHGDQRNCRQPDGSQP